MPRPREHGETTRTALLTAAERLLAEDGIAAVSVRSVAAAAGTTTRAIYSLFGSMDGLLTALSARTFDVLNETMDAYPRTADARDDLVGIGAEVYRRFVREHPSLYRLTFQRVDPHLETPPEWLAARLECFARVEELTARIGAAGRLGNRSVRQAAVEFNVVCEGLANAELRGGTLRDDAPPEQVWRDAFAALLVGWAAQPPAAGVTR